MNNRFNKIVSFFSPFSCEFSLVNRLIDICPSYFSFHSSNRKSKKSLKTHLYNLNNITLQTSIDLQSVVIVSDASIRNQIATSIAHVHIYDNPVIKIIHYVVNVISTEVELFTIRCGINQATCLFNISWIIVIMDSIHAAKRIFSLSLYPYQSHTLAISCKLREFFVRDHNNSIEFWDCLSYCR